MAAPLKPWEVAGNVASPLLNNAQGNPEVSLSSATAGAAPAVNGNEIQGAGRPPIPPRPHESPSLGMAAYGGGHMYGGGYGMGGMHPSPFMAGGYGMGYSPYNRMGGYNNINNDMTNSFTQQAEASAQGAFQSVESVVSAVSSISMMLESTYYALHNSFRAMLGVADQFARLKQQITAVAASFALFKFLRWLIHRMQVLVGLRKAGLPEDAWANAVAKSEAEAQQRFPGGVKSSWPFFAFIGVTIYLLRKIFGWIAGGQQAAGSKWADGTADHVVGECKYTFNASRDDELSIQQGQRINLAPADLQPRLRENDWLLASDGEKTGVVPANYIRVLGARKGKAIASTISTQDSESHSPADAYPPNS